MKTALSVTKKALRRFLLNKQCLTGTDKGAFNGRTESEEVLRMIQMLECVQLDPVSVAERNQHLVLAARLPGYDPRNLDRLLSQGKVFEYFANAACVIPIEDYPIIEPIRNRMQNQVQEPLNKLRDVADTVLYKLKTEGPLPSRAFTSEKRVHGYWDNKIPKTKETSLALNLLLDAGTIRVVRRDRTERYFDLTERTIPLEMLKQLDPNDNSAAREALIDKYMRAYRVFDPGDSRFGWQKMSAAERRNEINQRVQNETVVPLQVENVKRSYYIMADDFEELEETARTTKNERTSPDGPVTFLPPLDNLLWRRERIADLFDFNYKWEIYTPRSKRKYGPYAMPILCGDRLIGRLNPQLDRKNEQLIIQLLQIEPDVKMTSILRRNLNKALDSFAEFHKVKDIVVEHSDLT